MSKKIRLATALRKAPVRHRQDDYPPEVEDVAVADDARMETPTESPCHTAVADPAKASGVVRGLAHFFPKVAYGVFYYASFGVVFAAMKITHSIPTDNAMGHGVRDGAAAARIDFRKWKAPSTLAEDKETSLSAEQLAMV